MSTLGNRRLINCTCWAAWPRGVAYLLLYNLVLLPAIDLGRRCWGHRAPCTP
jgi:hypothetical protein